jgi:hypothetical protein
MAADAAPSADAEAVLVPLTVVQAWDAPVGAPAALAPEKNGAHRSAPAEDRPALVVARLPLPAPADGLNPSKAQPTAELPARDQLEKDLDAIIDPSAEQRARPAREQTIEGFLRSLGAGQQLGRRSQQLSSEEEEFVEDLISGTEKAKEYVAYVSAAVEYAKEWGVLPDRVKDAATNLGKIASGIESGLDRFGHVLAGAREILRLRGWLESLGDLASKTAALDMRDGASVEAWAAAAQEHFERTKPYVETMKSWLIKAAQRGSPVAARGALVLSVVVAYAEVGMAALSAGIKVVNAYNKRREDFLREAEGRAANRPSPPSYPGDWLTVAEQRASAQAARELEARLAVQRERERRRDELIRQFNETHFPAIYLRSRGPLKDRILRDFQAGRPVTRLRFEEGHADLPGFAPGLWWDCFVSTGGDTFFDERAGASRDPKKDQVNPAEAQTEMQDFARVEPPCPYYDELYQGELQAFLQRRISQGQSAPRAQSGLEIASLGVAVFEAGRSVLTSGDLSFEAAPASYRHDNTPPEIGFTQSQSELKIIAYHPRPGLDWQQFWFTLRFDYNGYDIRDAAVHVLIDRSSTMVASTFSIKFEPQAHSARNQPVAEIVFKISGRWNPVGAGDVSFEGDLFLKADGSVRCEIRSEKDWVRFNSRENERTTALPAPVVITDYHDVYFSPPGSHKLDDDTIRDIHHWYGLHNNDSRLAIERGLKPISLHGYASTTDSVAKNQELARKRMEAVQQVLRDLAGSQAQFQTFAHGELEAKTADNVESEEERRVRIEIRTVTETEAVP